MDRLYARFDAIARGRAHRSVIARLESNQRRAADLGWTAFVLERAGSTGRLVLLLRATGFALDRAPNQLHGIWVTLCDLSAANELLISSTKFREALCSRISRR